MRLSQWMMLIGVLVGIGCLQVTQRNALCLHGYAVGDRLRQFQADQTSVAWLRAQVDEVASPAHLAHVASQRQLKLVAWSTLAAAEGRGVASNEKAETGAEEAVLPVGPDVTGARRLAAHSEPAD